ncbi:MAG: hypothetical protein ACRECE_10125, partial [Xanthobacteraceae bacterium]
LAIADRAYVIEMGRIVLQGSGSELLGRADIAERYLGVGGSSSTARQGAAGERHSRLVRGIVDILEEG